MSFVPPIRKASWLAALLAPAAVLLLLPACDSGSSPVAPKGTVLAISADPPKIEPEGTSTIRVEARHPSGVAARAGTEIRFKASMGTIDPLARTDSHGIAAATFRADTSEGMATITATSGAEGLEGEYQTKVIIERSDNLLASFTTEPGPTDPPSLTVKFRDGSSGVPTGWEWEFGDGAGSRERNPLHVYARADSYLVTLRIARGAESDVTSRRLQVGAEAIFEAEIADLKVTFTDRSTGTPISWKWTFGDGEASAVKSPVHTYGSAGEYRVRLEIDTADAGRAATSQVLRVAAAPVTPPDADFDFATNGLSVIFTDDSDNEPTRWAWNFGDGAGSGEQNPVHTYAVAGTYLVTLTVHNAAGSDEIAKFVTVS